MSCCALDSTTQWRLKRYKSQLECPGSDIPVQSTVFQSVHSTHGAHCSSKEVETDGHTQGIRIHQHLDD